MKTYKWMMPVLWRNCKKLKFVDYRINKEGIVRRIKSSSGTYWGKISSSWVTYNGYERVCLTLDSKRYKMAVHRLVYETFGEKIKGQIDHLDDDKLNNHFSNLEDVSASVNVKRAYKAGLINRKGEDHNRAILTQNQVNCIRKILCKKKMNQVQLAKRFGVSRGAINGIALGRNWNL